MEGRNGMEWNGWMDATCLSIIRELELELELELLELELELELGGNVSSRRVGR